MRRPGFYCRGFNLGLRVLLGKGCRGRMTGKREVIPR